MMMSLAVLVVVVCCSWTLQVLLMQLVLILIWMLLELSPSSVLGCSSELTLSSS
jgi:hypothetical protein